MAGLLHRKKKKDREKENSPVTYDYSFHDTMEDITEGLPGQEDEAPFPPRDEREDTETASDTP